MKKYIKERLKNYEIEFMDLDVLAVLIHALALLLICGLVYWSVRQILLGRVHKIAAKTKSQWDDKLVEAHFFKRLVLLIPLFIFRYSVDAVMMDYQTSIPAITIAFEVLIALAVMRILIAFINALYSILSDTESYSDKPIKSYAQVMRFMVYIFFAITIFSLITGKTPMFFLTAMGAMSAIVLLIFKDSILGFIGSIQLATNDMVRIGDWITMEKYGADGTVIEINLATIKVQNFDLTITTIPTYALISDSFKNWRGMQESDGRRIKRALKIKTGSIQFCDEKLLSHFKGMRLLKDYILKMEKELADYNKSLGIEDSHQINGKSLTNIGVFRKYVELYLHENPNLNMDLTCMVRQLEVTTQGIPIEIYAFSKEKEWEKYESIMADIFDHLLAIIPQFHLEVFQAPTGSDFKNLA